jgi:hypothetical protein
MALKKYTQDLRSWEMLRTHIHPFYCLFVLLQPVAAGSNSSPREGSGNINISPLQWLSTSDIKPLYPATLLSNLPLTSIYYPQIVLLMA